MYRRCWLSMFCKMIDTEIYNSFNKYIHDYFFKKSNVGDSIIMAVDSSVVDVFCKNNHISVVKFHNTIKRRLRIDWQIFISKKIAIPNLFGIVAIQVFVASQMHKDDDFTASNYNSRLLEYLDLDNNNEIQKLYREYQDEIWQSLKKWALEKHFQVSIPKIGFGPGRYRQYPLSQALLNQEDLNLFAFIFNNIGLKPKEDISFLDFKSILSGADTRYNVTSHYSKIKEKLIFEEKLELLYIQLFTFYNQWNGEFSSSHSSTEQSKVQTNKIRTSLVLNSDITTIEVLDENNNVLKEINLQKDKFFKQIKPYYHQFNTSNKYSGIIVLVKDDSYDEWYDSRYLEIGKSCILIMNDSHHFNNYVNVLDTNIKNYSKNNLAIFEVNVTKTQFQRAHKWQDLFSKQIKPYTIEGGLKLSRQVWMLGAGPIIRFDRKTDAWINGTKLSLENDNLTYSLVIAKEGTYILKVKNQSPTTIVIEKSFQKEETVIGGWQINKENSTYKHSSEDYNINGLNVSFNEDNTSDYNTRLWINDVIKKTKKETNPISILSQALKRKNHGIY